MTDFINHLHRDLRNVFIARRGAALWPHATDDSAHKVYLRMNRIELPQPAELSMTLTETLQKRASYLESPHSGNITVNEWGTLLGNALKQRSESTHRPYPSGGGLYPIETYLLSSGIDESSPSAFHYNPSDHVLENLWPLPHNFDLKEIVRHPEELFFSHLVVFTSVWQRSSKKYGDFTYLLGLLETGHMSQNILLTATALGLRARPMGWFLDQKIAELLDLDEEEEQAVHVIALAKD